MLPCRKRHTPTTKHRHILQAQQHHGPRAALCRIVDQRENFIFQSLASVFPIKAPFKRVPYLKKKKKSPICQSGLCSKSRGITCGDQKKSTWHRSHICFFHFKANKKLTEYSNSNEQRNIQRLKTTQTKKWERIGKKRKNKRINLYITTIKKYKQIKSTLKGYSPPE